MDKKASKRNLVLRRRTAPPRGGQGNRQWNLPKVLVLILNIRFRNSYHIITNIKKVNKRKHVMS